MRANPGPYRSRARRPLSCLFRARNVKENWALVCMFWKQCDHELNDLGHWIASREHEISRIQPRNTKSANETKLSIARAIEGRQNCIYTSIHEATENYSILAKTFSWRLNLSSSTWRTAPGNNSRGPSHFAMDISAGACKISTTDWVYLRSSYDISRSSYKDLLCTK